MGVNMRIIIMTFALAGAVSAQELGNSVPEFSVMSAGVAAGIAFAGFLILRRK
jgi:hypothetical protein